MIGTGRFLAHPPEAKAFDPLIVPFCGLTPRLAKTSLLTPDLRADTGNECSQEAQVVERT